MRTSAPSRCPKPSAAKLQDAAVVAVPGEHRRGAAIGPPRFRNLAQMLLARLPLDAEQPPDLDLDRKVSRRPDIGASLGKQQIDFRRPAPDALDLGEERDGL